MTKRGRKPLADPSVPWTIYVPSTVAAQVDLILYDPVRERVRWGDKSELINLLLRAWLRGEIQVPRKSQLELL